MSYTSNTIIFGYCTHLEEGTHGFYKNPGLSHNSASAATLIPEFSYKLAYTDPPLVLYHVFMSGVRCGIPAHVGTIPLASRAFYSISAI
jgi:hypothetical protein